MTMTKVKGTSASAVILALMMWALAANTVKAQMITSSNQVIDCGQVLFRKPVTVHFELTNQG